MNDGALQRGPLALDPQEPPAEVEHEVVATMLDLWLQYWDAQADRGRGDLSLGDRALVVRGVHERMFAYIELRDKASS